MLLLLLLACAASPGDTATTAPTSPPDEAGPYRAGVTTLSWTDARGKPLVAELWYPAEDDPDAEVALYDPFTLTFDGLRDAPLDTRGAPYPLVGFSHGFMAVRYQSVYLTEYLASHGYVVVAPDHTYNTLFDQDDERAVQVLLERPGDVAAAVDRVLAEYPDWVGDGSYAAMGHSFGAVTSLILGGGEPALDGLDAYCEDNDVTACDYLPQLDDVDPSGYLTADSRVVTTVPLSPGLWYAFGEGGSGLDGVVDPLVLAGDADQILDYTDEIEPTFAALGKPRAMAVFAGAGHYAFSDLCLFAPFFQDECQGVDAGFMDLETAQHASKVLVTAWLDEHLAQRDSTDWSLEDWLDEQPELSWRE